MLGCSLVAAWHALHVEPGMPALPGYMVAAAAINHDRRYSTHPPTRHRRRKYKEETTRLNQQLKSASMGSKANDKAADRLQKEVDKLRYGGGVGA